ncbi:5-deoxy-glucuronate isomerase, partial [Streptomyces sp. JV190]|uniref:5-deoxy-glucuronate isomerase n=1 Tax=Streptomyces sp. JV190 TaxID=3002533 RepID=UPI002E7659B7
TTSTAPAPSPCPPTAPTTPWTPPPSATTGWPPPAPGPRTLRQLRPADQVQHHAHAILPLAPSRSRGTDARAEVRRGDAVLIPDAWHGHYIATPGRTLYYLNVMAG